MKANIEIEIEVKMGKPEPPGTFYVGQFPAGTSYKQLVKIFGKPQYGESPDGKIQAEWIGTINGLSFTIYDYKSDVKPQKNTEWHIGSNNKIASVLLGAYFDAF